MYAAAGSQQYSVTDIGNLSSQFPFCSVKSINSSGQVVGDSNVSPSNGAHGFFYAGNGAELVDLGSLGGNSPYVQSLANSINDSSWIAGSSGDEASVWTPQSGIQGVGFLGTGNSSVLYSISNSDVAVGGSTTLGGSYANAMIWDPTNGLRDLNSLIVNQPSTWTPTGAIAISPTGGLIAGIGFANISTSPPSGAEHAFVLNGGSLTEIPPLGPLGLLGIQPESINSSGEVAGGFYDANNRLHAFVYSSALGTVDIGNLGLSATGASTPYTQAFAINDLGTVVGSDGLADGSKRGFLWTEAGGMIAVQPPAGVIIDAIAGINDNGQMIGEGYYANDPALGYRGFVLSPVPEPSSLGLALSLVLLSFVWIIRRQIG